jgi:hypothetical protein
MRTVGGYGQYAYKGKKWLAHRLAWFVMHGSLESDKVVCHSCDNPCCVNPDHLRLDTQSGNVLEAVAKGRGYRGERNGNAKLTDGQAAEIYRRREAGEKLDPLAAEFGVSTSTISNIARKRRRVA